MLFKRKKPNESRRTRRPAANEGLNTQPVFSYHARSSSRTEFDSGGRRSGKSSILLANSAKPLRNMPRRWSRRVVVTLATVVVLALAINVLVLDRNPSVVTVADTEGQRLLLRDQKIYAEAAKAVLKSSLANTNKLTVDTTRIAETMKQQFPELENVAVTLPIAGRQPIVHVQPAKPALLLRTADGQIFVLNKMGRAVMDARQIRDASKLGLPVAIEDQSGLEVALGRTALPSDNVAFITEVLGQLKAKNIAVTALVLPAGTSELDVRVEGAPYIIKFNLHGDARAEVGSFLAVKQHLERKGKTPAEYIDVRVDNKAYYR